MAANAYDQRIEPVEAALRYKGKKILCICQAGVSRSVGLMTLLKFKYAADAIAAGTHCNSPETMTMLLEWADVVIFCDRTLMVNFPSEYLAKTKIWDVGPDRYFGGIHGELIEQYEQHIAADV